MIILYFLLGGIYSLMILSAGFLFGYYYKNGKLPENISKFKDHFADVGNMDAGPVKPITKQEREAEDKKGFTDRVKELTSD